MKTQSLFCGSLAAFAQFAQSIPTSTQDVNHAEIEKRGIIDDAIKELKSDLSSLANDGFDTFGKILTNLDAVKPTATPTSPAQAFDQLSKILAPSASPTPNIYGALGEIVAAGLTSDTSESIKSKTSSPENNFANVNNRKSSPPAFPKADRRDAPFSVKESDLRAAIHIPRTFQYGAPGAPQPIILVPGTGSTGYLSFQGNYIKLLQGSKIADPVWLNIPEFALGDIQVNAEYVAYAINYIYGISNHRKVAVATWSQGSIMGAWAYKYWPSARSRVTDQISISPDYHGTTQANLISPPGIALPASVLQQQYNSIFIKTLRTGGGAQAYVPTTNVYSSFFDEIVQPQSGVGASGYLLSSSRARASNTDVQKTCPLQPAGGFYDHETTLVNPLGYALLVDALSHDGPGELSRIDVKKNCGLLLSPGLGLGDFLATQNNLLVAGTQLLLDNAMVLQEPQIKSYARSNPFRY